MRSGQGEMKVLFCLCRFFCVLFKCSGLCVLFVCGWYECMCVRKCFEQMLGLHYTYAYGG